MSVPTEFDFMLIKAGDGDSPEVFTLICGIDNVTVNRTVSTTDRYPRDCAAPGLVPTRRVRTTGKAMDVTGSGMSNADTVEDLEEFLGVRKNYKIEGYQADGTPAGVLLGTFAGSYVMTAANIGSTNGGESTGEITLASDGTWTYTAAP